MALMLELLGVVDNQTAEEGRAHHKSRLSYDQLSFFRLDTLHHTLDKVLAEIVYEDFIAKKQTPMMALVTTSLRTIVMNSHSQNEVSNGILKGMVTLQNGWSQEFNLIVLR